ncbi:MAG: hypothetical protein HOP31_12955 [Ignavibacteria bacterium]|nr:hypothetical protein [Ignavibacteria bacterium]
MNGLTVKIKNNDYTIPSGSVVIDLFTAIPGHELTLLREHFTSIAIQPHKIDEEIADFKLNEHLIDLIAKYRLNEKFIHNINTSTWYDTLEDLHHIHGTYIYGEYEKK